MSRAGKITRRGFMVAGLVVAGGVGFVAWKASETPDNPLTGIAGQATLNPWLMIGPDGPTIIVPRAEMGQGVQGTLAALVAEELDVDFASVRVIHGPPAKAYYLGGAAIGGSLSMRHYESAEKMAKYGAMLDWLPKILSLQFTGGSTSTVDAFHKMRLAGATAREALKEAAAKRYSVKASVLKTENGEVIIPDGTRIPYAELAEEAAALPTPKVELRAPDTWKILGTSQMRPDMPSKLDGSATFGVDVRLEGMKFASLRRNPHLGGEMISVDTAPAFEISGVDEVILLPDGVAVVARNSWAAMQGANALAPEWGASTIPATQDEIFGAIEAAFEGKVNSTLRDDGDLDVLAPEGAKVIEAEYRVPYLAHSTMEPMNATALVEGERLRIWGGFQGPLLAARNAAKAIGFEPENATAEVTFLGGGFGRRAESDFAEYAARVAAHMPGTPVQLLWSREEDMTHDAYRPGAIAKAWGWVKDGQAGAFDMKVAAQSVTGQAVKRLAGISMGGPDKSLSEGIWDQPYGIKNYRVEAYKAALDVPVGFWRSVGNSYGGFFHESFIDELAHGAGVDPMAFRLDLVRGEHAPSAAVLQAVAQMSDWDGARAANRALGVALTHSFGTAVAQVIEVEEVEGGAVRIVKAWIACDPGIALDPRNIEGQMISGLIYGLSAAVSGEITFADGAVDQQNFPDYDALRMHNAPAVEVRILQHGGEIGGIGEPGTPPAAPALANALFALSGKRVRELPLRKQFEFL
ncbi:MAG: isoquinoline 1-oxidoreductase beta subunit [Halocynthiibacter sp.]|jgi:isoquinoline 1-oxidoreductase beta subunit